MACMMHGGIHLSLWHLKNNKQYEESIFMLGTAPADDGERTRY